MSATAPTARQLLERTGEHPVVSLLFDLDPERFATPPARASQLRSLLDEGRRKTADHDQLDHAERSAVRADLDRIEALLGGGDAPVEGARGLAVYASGQDGLFETVRLDHPVQGRLVIARSPDVEPLVANARRERWCIALVSRRTGRIFDGAAEDLREQDRITDDVHGQHRQGGWSQARYERSYEAETDAHLREVATELYRLWQHHPFERLFLGGPEEIVGRLAGDLHKELRSRLADARVSLDVDTASPADLRAAAARLLDDPGQSTVAELEEHLGRGTAVIGLEGVLDALNQRRVGKLVIEHNFSVAGRRCPLDGLLYPAGTEMCPSDGNPTSEVADLRASAVGAGVLQDAEIAVVGEGHEVPPPVLVRAGGIAALLRF